MTLLEWSEMARYLQKTDKKHKNIWPWIEWNVSTQRLGKSDVVIIWEVLWWFSRHVGSGKVEGRSREIISSLVNYCVVLFCTCWISQCDNFAGFCLKKIHICFLNSVGITFLLILLYFHGPIHCISKLTSYRKIFPIIYNMPVNLFFDQKMSRDHPERFTES